SDIFKRTVLFRSVQAGEPNGTVYPFIASLTVHDFSPGWPPNKYYGKTCLSKVEGGRYTMTRDRLREWTVEGRTTFSEPVCSDNPSERVSSFPIDSLTGTRVGSSAPVPKIVTQGLKTFRLKLGEYACILPGGRLAANTGFRLKRDKSYTDATGARGGTYVYEPFATTLAFHGGFLDGQSAKYADGSGFVLSPTLTCSPWQ
ncbi:MAG: hypothetical protein ABI789_11255, partial [Usitatibacter sp.]